MGVKWLFPNRRTRTDTRFYASMVTENFVGRMNGRFWYVQRKLFRTDFSHTISQFASIMRTFSFRSQNDENERKQFRRWTSSTFTIIRYPEAKPIYHSFIHDTLQRTQKIRTYQILIFRLMLRGAQLANGKHAIFFSFTYLFAYLTACGLSLMHKVHNLITKVRAAFPSFFFVFSTFSFIVPSFLNQLFLSVVWP